MNLPAVVKGNYRPGFTKIMPLLICFAFRFNSLVLTTKKLQVAEQQFAQEKRVIKRLENELLEKKKLEESLSEMTAKVGELQTKPKSKDKHCKECLEHLKHINELNSKIETLDAQQAGVLQQKEKLEKELIDQVKLKDKIREMESKVK